MMACVQWQQCVIGMFCYMVRAVSSLALFQQKYKLIHLCFLSKTGYLLIPQKYCLRYRSGCYRLWYIKFSFVNKFWKCTTQKLFVHQHLLQLFRLPLASPKTTHHGSAPISRIYHRHVIPVFSFTLYY